MYVKDKKEIFAVMIFTIGHHIRTEQEFLDLLRAHHIDVLVDVRSFPGSRRSPQYNQEVFSVWLQEAGVEYRHIPDLGGRRRTVIPDSPNGGWTNDSFHSYADWTTFPEWKRAFRELRALARVKRVAYMCGEPHPSRCHRTIISDHMEAHHVEVYHILDEKRLERHVFGGWGAKPHVDGCCVTYPPDPSIPVQLSFDLF